MPGVAPAGSDASAYTVASERARYHRLAVTFLTVLLVLGSIARIVVLVMRPRAARRFRQPRRRLLATRLEQTGDLVVFVTACSMVAFGYGHHPSATLVLLWTVALIGGFSSVLMAHAVARNHRAEPRQWGSAAELSASARRSSTH